jgi:hypothetical protein
MGLTDEANVKRSETDTAMTWLARHPRLVALAAVAGTALAILAIALVRSRPAGGCTIPPPIPAVPDQLRALGDFDQPYNATETRTLQDAALRVATALHAELGGARVGDPVDVRALRSDRHDAIVFALGTNPGANGAPRTVEGLVVFLRDCSGQAYYSEVDDLLRTTPAGAAPAAFPEVTRDEAAAALGGGNPELVYTTSPLQPLWRDPSSGKTTAATP